MVTLAEESENAKYFKDALRSLILSRLTEKESTQENVGMAVARRILLLIEHDDTFVDELSTGERLPVRTVTYLWLFLIGHLEMRSLLIYSLTYTISLIYWNIRLRSYRTGHW